MADLKPRIMEILRQPQLAGFATVTTEGKPWVRYVVSFTGEDLTIRFASFANSRKVAQLNSNPEVHLTCGVSNQQDMRPYLQIQGRAQFVTDRAERHGFWNDLFKNYFQGPDDPNYGVVVIKPYRIELWSPGSLTPEVWEA
jgi:general stress protein 26